MKNKLKFAVFTDPHLNTPTDAPFLSMLTKMAEVCAAEQVDAVIALGDNLNMLGRMHHASNVLIEDYLHSIMSQTADATGLPLFAINGNHDGIGTDFFDLPLWNRAIGSQFTKGRSVHEGDSAYYYVDYPANELRLVFLSMPYGADLAAELPTPLWAYGEQQLRWLASTALAVPDGYDVLFVAHVPTYYEYANREDGQLLGVFNGKEGAFSTIASLCGWIEDRDTLVAIVDAFQEKRRGTIPALGLQVDYSRAGRLLAQISGHMHDDQLLYPGDAWRNLPHPLPCPQVVVARAITPKEPGYLFDVITVEEACLTLRRYGDGEDRIVKL